MSEASTLQTTTVLSNILVLVVFTGLPQISFQFKIKVSKFIAKSLSTFCCLMFLFIGLVISVTRWLLARCFPFSAIKNHVNWPNRTKVGLNF